MKKAIVLGAGGFIGSHLVKKLKKEGFWVRGVDLKYPPFAKTLADEFIIGDLREQDLCRKVIDAPFDELYQLAADMGGAGYIFTGDKDADIMHNSALININTIEAAWKNKVKKIFYSSSACIYPEHNQLDANNPKTAEISAYPANPDSEYGWEKLFSERLYMSFSRNYGMICKIARFHNIFGEECTYNDGKEKAPAAICRKVALAANRGEIEIWGDGKQTRSFLYINECLEGVRKLMDHPEFHGPVNIGSDEMVSINELVNIAAKVAEKSININHIPGPLGVRGRTSDNELIQQKLNWKPNYALEKGIKILYDWIMEQLKKE